MIREKQITIKRIKRIKIKVGLKLNFKRWNWKKKSK